MEPVRENERVRFAESAKARCYVFVCGVASNASNLQIFEAKDLGRRGYRLNLRGAEIEWVDHPADAPSIERSIRRQRALQQETRMARVGESRRSGGT